MSITYRKAEERDLEQLFNLAIKFTEYNAKGSNDHEYFFRGDWETYFKEEILESIRDTEESSFWIAEDTANNTLVGYQVGKFHQSPYYFALDELYVLEEYREQGIAKKLIEECIKFGKKFDCDIRLEVYLWNKATIEYYRKLGFTDSALVMEYKN